MGIFDSFDSVAENVLISVISRMNISIFVLYTVLPGEASNLKKFRGVLSSFYGLVEVCMYKRKFKY